MGKRKSPQVKISHKRSIDDVALGGLVGRHTILWQVTFDCAASFDIDLKHDWHAEGLWASYQPLLVSFKNLDVTSY